jgi:post-segregation antitoxin (ccd killing protein)
MLSAVSRCGVAAFLPHSRCMPEARKSLPAGWVADVYSIHMARVNITVPDELLVRARLADLNVSRVASAALLEELDRLAKIAELDEYLASLNQELGPPSEEEVAAARVWVDELLQAKPAKRRRHRGAA